MKPRNALAPVQVFPDLLKVGFESPAEPHLRHYCHCGSSVTARVAKGWWACPYHYPTQLELVA